MFTSKRILLRTLERQQQAHDARVDQLVGTIAHLAGKPLPRAYQPPPSSEPQPVDEYEDV